MLEAWLVIYKLVQWFCLQNWILYPATKASFWNPKAAPVSDSDTSRSRFKTWGHFAKRRVLSGVFTKDRSGHRATVWPGRHLLCMFCRLLWGRNWSFPKPTLCARIMGESCDRINIDALFTITSLFSHKTSSHTHLDNRASLWLSFRNLLTGGSGLYLCSYGAIRVMLPKEETTFGLAVWWVAMALRFYKLGQGLGERGISFAFPISTGWEIGSRVCLTTTLEVDCFSLMLIRWAGRAGAPV